MEFFLILKWEALSITITQILLKYWKLIRYVILKQYRPVPKQTGSFLSNTDLILEIGGECLGKIKLYANNIGRSMRRLGFESDSKKINGKTLRGYWVARITDMERANNESKYEEPPF